MFLGSIIVSAAVFRLAAQAEPPPVPPPSLHGVRVPEVDDLDDYLASRQAAIVLGKALFWDQQAGSDGMACASCHFHAGADDRFVNQLSPSLNHQDPARAGVFDTTHTGGGGPNYALRRGDFPFHVLSNPDDRDSSVLFDMNDVASSAGVFKADFVSVGSPAGMTDSCQPRVDDLFHIGTLNTRRVEPRNTPTTINSAFNFRNFWDGRANNVFNGVDPFGPRDTAARIKRWSDGRLVDVRVRLRNSSLASQAVGPPLSGFEMSCVGRTFPDLGRKLIDRRALQFQSVAADDSVLAGHLHATRVGLVETYRTLIQRAFRSELWTAPGNVLTPAGFTQIENNFSLFWGLAIQLYEGTLVSDDAPYDRFAAGDPNALTAAQRRGFDVFMGPGNCIACHKGPLFTGATLALFAPARAEEDQLPSPIERMLMGDGRLAIYDDAFYNIGVRPTVEDLGVGGRDPFGNPLSFTRQWQQFLLTGSPTVDRFRVDPGQFAVPVPLPPSPTRAQLLAAFGNDPEAVDGAFKVPTLRNVELTGPYFHNGGQATLEEVVRFYNRGGDRRRTGNGGANTTGFGTNPSNLDPDIEPLGLSAQQQADLVAFLKSLTDERVRWEVAPFDHPQLAVMQGHSANVNPRLGAPMAADLGTVLPEVGRGGRAVLGLPALRPFADQLH
ncbi:MAG TPA: cytochrome c peroxidase [Burkholderiaceae bacterium]|nr:cytochrome c peroxidase [Burkholderiaceae bacterium]